MRDTHEIPFTTNIEKKLYFCFMELLSAFFIKDLQELSTVETVFECGDYNSTANCAYFASSHSVITVLGLDGIKS